MSALFAYLRRGKVNIPLLRGSKKERDWNAKEGLALLGSE